MKIKGLLAVMLLGLIASAFGQKQTLDLTFTAVENAAYIQLDSINSLYRIFMNMGE